MARVYRSMKADGELPLVAQSAVGLGVRPDDIKVDASGDVQPNSGGMSVAPEWRSLPHWRIPRRLLPRCHKATGRDELVCWRWGEGEFQDDSISSLLVLRVDAPGHGLVEPVRVVSLADYRSALADTRSDWSVDEA